MKGSRKIFQGLLTVINEKEKKAKNYYWKQPKDKAFERLVDLAIKKTKEFLFVDTGYWYYKLTTGKELIKELEPYLIEIVHDNKWPGTETLKKVKIYHYRLNIHSGNILKKYYSCGVYDCIKNGLPEDLCFMKSRAVEWLVNISHEEESYIVLEDESELEVLKSINDLDIEVVSENRERLPNIFNGINIHTQEKVKIILWTVNEFNGGNVLIPCDLILLSDENYKKHLVRYSDVIKIYNDLLYPVSNYGNNVKILLKESIDEVLLRLNQLLKLSLSVKDYRIKYFSSEYEKL